jgi:ATP-dependent helicase/nuclease subunit A
MDELVAKRSALARARARYGGPDDLAAAIRTLLHVPPGMAARDVLAAGCTESVLPVPALRRAADVLAQGGVGDVRQAARLCAVLDAPDRVAAFADYCTVFLTGTGGRRRVLASRAVERLDAGVESILRAEQERVCALLAEHRAALVAEASEAAFMLGGALLDAYDAEKAARAALDYEDLILKTRDLLRERADASWILSKLDGGIDHVLIDEAQDTSPEQWQVVQALTEEFFAGEGARAVRRTVFAVGDEKQSIYGFQGADPHAFGRMRDFFAARVRGARFDWRDEALALSFRSTPELLKAVDLVFDQPHARAGLGRADRPIRHSAFRTESAGLVEIWPTIRPDVAPPVDPWDAPVDPGGEEGPMARLAARIADTVAGWLRDGVRTADGPPLRPGDVLILVRRRNAFVDAMVRALKHRGVPVAGADRLRLTDQLAVKDLVAFGRCLLQPDDDLTLAAVLRGPLMGLSEEGLFALAHDRPGTLWQALERAAADGATNAAAALALLIEGAQAAASAPFDFYSDLLGPLGGRRLLAARLGSQANDPIDAFLDAALHYEALEPPSLEGFLHAIETGAPEIRRDYEHGRDEARVMTVHGAKGLEASVVFLADTCAVPNARHDPKLIPAGPDDTLLLWPIRKANDTPESAHGRQTARRARDEEHRRLLYVAMTRARDRLYVCGYETARPLPPDCWYRLVADALVPACAAVDLGFGAPAWRLGRMPNSKAR